MIASFRDDWLRRFFVDDIRSRQIPPALAVRVFRKLQLLDDSTTEQDLCIPPGNRFERLRGGLSGYCSLRVNQQWRLIFRWDSIYGVATEVYLDPHTYQ
ncbi:MAG: type II toxin-antitoxin system RelE/ParE family toxin [Bryobacterales bacterium]|nr:type II toxin-antitoxin system RelE/ParE family toxin [Bryobacterales bacterium]